LISLTTNPIPARSTLPDVPLDTSADSHEKIKKVRLFAQSAFVRKKNSANAVACRTGWNLCAISLQSRRRHEKVERSYWEWHECECKRWGRMLPLSSALNQLGWSSCLPFYILYFFMISRFVCCGENPVGCVSLFTY